MKVTAMKISGEPQEYLSRCEFLKISGVALLVVALSACAVASSPIATPAPTNTPLPTNTPEPTATPTPKPTNTPIPSPTPDNIEKALLGLPVEVEHLKPQFRRILDAAENWPEPKIKDGLLLAQGQLENPEAGAEEYGDVTISLRVLGFVNDERAVYALVGDRTKPIVVRMLNREGGPLYYKDDVILRLDRAVVSEDHLKIDGKYPVGVTLLFEIANYPLSYMERHILPIVPKNLRDYVFDTARFADWMAENKIKLPKTQLETGAFLIEIRRAVVQPYALLFPTEANSSLVRRYVEYHPQVPKNWVIQDFYTPIPLATSP